MLSLFPQLLFLAPAGVALLRISAGLMFIYWAHVYWRDNQRMATERFPIIGSAPSSLIIVGALISAVLGVLLLLGIWTQVVALLGMLGALKNIIWSKRYPGVFPFSRDASFLLFVVCASLVVSGAGAFAFDFPL